jgi:transcriptional regulator with XRE-family HTH domain
MSDVLRFGEKLHQLRLYYHLTLKDFAVRLGYSSHGYIKELESGKKSPTVFLVVKIARMFNITTDALLKDELDLTFPVNKNEESLS